MLLVELHWPLGGCSTEILSITSQFACVVVIFWCFFWSVLRADGHEAVQFHSLPPPDVNSIGRCAKRARQLDGCQNLALLPSCAKRSLRTLSRERVPSMRASVQCFE